MGVCVFFSVYFKLHRNSEGWECCIWLVKCDITMQCVNWSVSLCAVLQASGAEGQFQSHDITVISSDPSLSSLSVACLLCGSRGCDDADVCIASWFCCQCWYCLHSMQSKVYEMVQCPSVCLSLLSHSPAAAACCRFAAVGPACKRYQLIAAW